MSSRITPRLVELTYEALLKSYWRKEALRKFLRASHIADSHLSSWSGDESKREFLDRTFPKLQASDRGKSLITEMAKSLSEQVSFPDLRGWENSAEKISEARRAVEELKLYLMKQDEEVRTERDREAVRARANDERREIRRQVTDRSKLQVALEGLTLSIGTQQGGFDFQDWFYELIQFSELVSRKPYVSSGRQIDGTVTHEGTTYLVELKFTSKQASSTDIDSLKAKVDNKADNTMGIMVSISGYSTTAIAEASGRQSKLLLFDASHLYLFLQGVISFPEIISRIRRHASQTGEAYLAANRLYVGD